MCRLLRFFRAIVADVSPLSPAQNQKHPKGKLWGGEWESDEMKMQKEKPSAAFGKSLLRSLQDVSIHYLSLFG